MPSRYSQPVDPSRPNNAHSIALELVGWNQRVLELGAAAGHVTRALVERRCDVTSVEYERDAARDLEGLAAHVINGDLDDPQVFAGLVPEFDVVLAGDVLEHLRDPVATLARAVRMLAPGGRVVVSLPHVGHVDVRLALSQGVWDYRDFGLMDRTHLRFFTLKTIREMIHGVGFVITDLRRVRMPAFETELDIDRAQIDTELLSSILEDPEAETYQFVFAAARDDGNHRLQRLSERQPELEHELDRLRVRYAALRADHERSQDAEHRLRLLEAELARLRARVATVDGSIVWQLFQRTRNGVFGALGGEGSWAACALQAVVRMAGRVIGLGGRGPAR